MCNKVLSDICFSHGEPRKQTSLEIYSTWMWSYMQTGPPLYSIWMKDRITRSLNASMCGSVLMIYMKANSTFSYLRLVNISWLCVMHCIPGVAVRSSVTSSALINYSFLENVFSLSKKGGLEKTIVFSNRWTSLHVNKQVSQHVRNKWHQSSAVLDSTGVYCWWTDGAENKIPSCFAGF